MSLLFNLLIGTALLHTSNGDVRFDVFKKYTSAEIIDHIEKLSEEKKGEISSTTCGHTVNHQRVKIIRIPNAGPSGPRPIVLLDGALYGCNWKSTYFLLHLVDQLMYNSSFFELRDTYHWIIAPLLNPDGYQYYQDNPTEIWVKNRQLTNGASCYGTNLLLNFNYYWGQSKLRNNPCDHTYTGPMPFSEQETISYAYYLYKLHQKVSFYISYHTSNFYQKAGIMYAWGHTYKRPSEWRSLHEVARRTFYEISLINNTQYLYGTINATNELNMSGVSVDWMRYILGVKNSFMVVIEDKDIETYLKESMVSFLAIPKYLKRFDLLKF